MGGQDALRLVKSSRLWRDCRGEACLARRVRRTRIVIILCTYFTGETRLARRTAELLPAQSACRMFVDSL